MVKLTMKEAIRAKRQGVLDTLVELAKIEQKKARSTACTGVRLYADGEVSREDVLEDIDNLRKATTRVELLSSLTVLDLEADEVGR